MMEQIIKLSMLPTDFLMKVGGGTPILATLFYIFTWLGLTGVTCFVFIKKMSKRALVFTIFAWAICFPYLYFNAFMVFLWLVMWACDLAGGGSSCYL